MQPDKVNDVVHQNEPPPISNVVRLGRSNQSIIYHQTIQIQTCCIRE